MAHPDPRRCQNETMGRNCHHACCLNPQHGGRHQCIYCATMYEETNNDQPPAP